MGQALQSMNRTTVKPIEAKKTEYICPDFKEFSDASSIHGLSKLGNAKRLSSKVGWGLFLLVWIGCLSYCLSDLIISFLEYKTLIITEQIQNSSLQFPCVTLCNANNLQASKISRYVDLEKILQTGIQQSLQMGMVLPTLIFGMNYSMINSNNLTYLKETHSATESMFLKRFKGWCTWSLAMECSEKDFVDFLFYSNFGFCKTFNLNGTYRQFSPGIITGLSMKLYLNQDDHANFLNIDQGAGVLLMVHSSDEYPNPVAKGMLIPPGQMARIGVKKKIIKRKKAPYTSKCTDGKPGIVFPYRYTLDNCVYSCYSGVFERKGGIVDAAVTYHRQEVGKRVSLNNQTASFDIAKCQIGVIKSLSQDPPKCDCPPACYEEQYQLTTSYSRWPTEVDRKYYKPVFANILNRSEVSDDFIDKNFLAFHMFYEDLSYELVTEEPVISVMSLISNFGGQLGLWFGASLFSVMELLAFIGKRWISGKNNAGEMQVAD